MKRQVDLERRLRSLSALHETVGAMKSLSAHHFRETRRAVDAARAYYTGVQRMLAWSAASIAAGEGPPGMLVLGAELGLCGGYNARVVDAAIERRAQLGPGPTFCVGRRAAAYLRRRGETVQQVYSAPTSVRGISGLLLELAEDILTAYASERLSSFDIVSNRFVGVGRVSPAHMTLLPVEPQPTPPSPSVRYATSEAFAFAATREFLYISLYDLLLDALASEHGARLMATQSAEGWLEGRTAHIRRHLMATRREASTQEVIEIAAGARVRRQAGGSNRL